MARVFISYRRADGQYAVGWIEERLRQIDVDADVQTAFRDSDLRYGDDFPDRLADEVKECDVLIAVIGPQWHGASDHEPSRILDPADWVGREITSALNDPDKLIIPVLLDGVEPLRANDLLPAHRRFADLHALRFDQRDDLEALAEQVRDHLTRVDAARVRLEGLDEPLTPPRWRPLPIELVVAAIAAVTGGLLSWGGASLIGEGNRPWLWCAIAQAAFWAGGCVVGLSYTRQVLTGAIDVDWRVVARSTGVAVLLIALTVTSIAPGDDDQVVITVIEAMAAVALLSPWIFALVGAGWSRTTSTGVRQRALVIARQRRALGAAVGVLAVTLALSVLTSATVVNDTEASWVAWFSIVGFGIFMSMVMMGGIEYGHARLRHDSDLLRVEISELSAQSRRHVADVLVEERGDLWPGIPLWVAVPTVAAVVAAIALAPS